MSESRHAILIASSQFEDRNLKALRCPDNDVDGLFDVLNRKGGFEKRNILKLKNEPSYKVLAHANKIFKSSSKDDLIILYYSGHGKLNSVGKLHLTTVNTDLSILEATSIPGEVLKTYADISLSRKVVFILDCCYSGAIGEAFSSKGSADDQLHLLSKGRGIYIISSSTGIQVSQENRSDTYSVFTKHLIEGVLDGSADLNGDGSVSIDELYSYIQDQIKKEGSQEPMKWNIDVRGNPLVIATTGEIPRQKRKVKIRTLLLGLQEKDILPDPLVSIAIDVISSPSSELSDTHKLYDDLLSKWMEKGIGTADLIHEWYTIGMYKNEITSDSQKQSINRDLATEENKRFNNDSDSQVPEDQQEFNPESQRFVEDFLSTNESKNSQRENETIKKDSGDECSEAEHETDTSGKSKIPTQKILILAVSPRSLNRLRLDQEVREICDVLRKSRAFHFIVEVRWAVQVSDLQDIMLQFDPQIVHFCGHGGAEGIVLEDKNGKIRQVEPYALASLFKLFSGQIDCVIFNACYSESAARAIIPSVNYVIGMELAISDQMAVVFAREFYRALSYGRTVDKAYGFGCSAMRLNGSQGDEPTFKRADTLQDIQPFKRQEVLDQWLRIRKNAKRILVLAVNPMNTTPLRLGEEVRAIYESLDSSISSGEIAIEQCWGVRFGDLQEVLTRFKPHVVHFTGHSEGEEGLVFEDEVGMAALVKAQPLSKLFDLCAGQVECLILNTSYSAGSARELTKHIDYVVGQETVTSDTGALAYATGFYRAFSLNASIHEAHTSGCLELERQGLTVHEKPILFSKDSQDNLVEQSVASDAYLEHELAIYQSQVEQLLNQTNNQAYNLAVDLLVKVKSLMHQLDRKSEFEDLLIKLQKRYKRKRNFIKLMIERGLLVDRQD